MINSSRVGHYIDSDAVFQALALKADGRPASS